MSIFQNATNNAIATLEVLRTLEPLVEKTAAAISTCLLSGGKLLVCGNGGSAADGADFSAEYGCRFMNDRQPFPAINLTACSSLTTAIGNDYGFEQLFARQVRGFAKPGDVLVALSTSGNSPNILAALREAGSMGITSIALLGRDGGSARGIASIDLIVPSSITARIQEAHKFLLHVVCEMVEQTLPSPPRP